MITFKETETLGRGRYIKVNLTTKVGPKHSMYKKLQGKPVTIPIGRIEYSRDGQFRYFEPMANEFNAKFAEKDLEALKDRILIYKGKSH